VVLVRAGFRFDLIDSLPPTKQSILFFLRIDSFGHATLQFVVKIDVTRLETSLVVENYFSSSIYLQFISF